MQYDENFFCFGFSWFILEITKYFKKRLLLNYIQSKKKSSLYIIEHSFARWRIKKTLNMIKKLNKRFLEISTEIGLFRKVRSNLVLITILKVNTCKNIFNANLKKISWFRHIYKN